ncbi:MAG: DNA recombination protein RmuC [Planctomycetota bacterium]
MEVLWVLIGLVLGLAVGIILATQKTRGLAQAEQLAANTREAELVARLTEIDKELAASEARLETLRATHEAEKKTSEDLRRELRDSFQALAGQALKDNSASILQKTELQLKPFQEQLKTLAEQTRELEQQRGKAQGALKQQLDDLLTSTKDLRLKSESLSVALRGSSQARGQWGENVVSRVFELAGMTEGMHYRTQETTKDGQRPDFVVLLPGGDAIPVDSKVPMAAFLDAQSEQDPARRKQLLTQHAQDLRGHVRTLEKKDYSSSVEGEIDFTVMFLPGDHLLEAAYQVAPDLQEDAMTRGVLIATPVTLLALLRTVSLYWQQKKLERNAKDIVEVAREYHGRMKVFTDHLSKAGNGLNTAVKAYNSAVGSFNRKVLPQGRRLEEKADVDPRKTLVAPEELTTEPRTDLPPPSEREMDAGA